MYICTESEKSKKTERIPDMENYIVSARKYRADYEENTKRLNELNSNPDAIEQVAREKYLMKKPNEDIYVFEDNK